MTAKPSKSDIQTPIFITALVFLFLSVGLSILLGTMPPTQNVQRQRYQPIAPVAPIAAEDAEPIQELHDLHFTDEDFATHVAQLKRILPSDDFQIIIEKPFVVVGDQGVDTIQRWASGTVKWAVDRIKRDYFSKDPDEIITIWLFKDKISYDYHNNLLFGSQPHTPFGYYSPAKRALVMNIATGGGTLVHEIVHPFMASNFSACPAWFNEGLASLYEQSRDSGGQIKGNTNWRLRGLQLAIEDNRLPRFETLCHTTTREFYGGESTNYAQARYLCFYLQEHDKLNAFYHAFKKNVAADPTGYQTLQQILGRTDMEVFQQEWDAYCLALRFPE